MYVLLGMLLFSQHSQAQSNQHPELNELSVSWHNANRSLVDEEGSPYWYNEWLPGTIQSVQGNNYSGIKMKFDLQNGRLLVKQSADPNPRMMNPIHIKSFSIERNDSAFTFHRHLVPISDVKKPTDVFFMELVAGNYYFLAKPVKEEQPDGGNLAQSDDRREVIYVDVVKYYIQNPSGQIIAFRNSKKVKTLIFGEDLSHLEKYARQNKLRWGKTADLVKIIGQANQLLTDGR